LMSKKVRKIRRKSIVKRIIESCNYIVKRGSDPFQVDISEYIKQLKEFIEKISSIEDLILDLNAIEGISKVIEMQGEWIRNRSTKLYFDPLLIEWKVKNLTLKQLALIIASAWHPIATIKTFTPKAIETAINYWINLPPLKNRWGKLPKPIQETTIASIENLIKEKLALKGTFNEMLKQFYRKLIEISKGKPISYWKFILDDDYQITILKAYMISFLATYGYINLEYNPKTRDYTIIPMKRKGEKRIGTSIVIPISIDEWKKRRGEG